MEKCTQLPFQQLALSGSRIVRVTTQISASHLMKWGQSLHALVGPSPSFASGTAKDASMRKATALCGSNSEMSIHNKVELRFLTIMVSPNL